MVLYHVVSTYQLLHCIIHREVFNKKETCCVILSDFIKNKYPHYMKLKGIFFDEVYMYNNDELLIDNNILENTNNVFNEFLVNNYIELKQFSDIIVGCAHSFFGIFLVSNKIQFTYLEDASGLLSRPQVIEDIEERIFLNKHIICKEYGLYNGKNDLIVKKICNLNTQIEGYYDENIEHFDLMEEIIKIDNSFMNRVIDFFGINEKIEINKESIIILTQHFANLNIMSFEEQKKIYRLIVDYFTQGYDLVFKPHPDDLMYYELLFPKSNVIKINFPSELVPFVFTEVPNTVMTVTSTAINNLDNFFQNCIKFSMEFEKNFNNIHKYYSVIKIIKELNKDYNLYEINCDKVLLENILRYTEVKLIKNIISMNDLNSISNKKIIIIDDLNMNKLSITEHLNCFFESVDEETIIFFINSNKEYIFYNYPNKEVFENIIPVEIKHSNLNDENEDYSEVIYIYTRRREIRNMINEIEFKKILENSNEIIRKETFSEDKLKIKVLEGILEATEKRLDHYIKLESELRIKLRNLENN